MTAHFTEQRSESADFFSFLRERGYTLTYVQEINGYHYCLSGHGQMERFSAETMNDALEQALKIIASKTDNPN